MKKFTLILLVFLLFPLMALAQADFTSDSLIINGKKLLQQGLNNWTESDLLNSRAYFERMLANSNPQEVWLIHYYIAFSDWRLGTFYMSKQNKKKALQFVNEGIEHAKQCIEKKDDFADAHSLLGSLYGNKIGLKPILGMTLGPKSGIQMGKAMSLDEANPRNYLIAGQSAFFTPKIFGGGKDKAKDYFEKAIVRFDSFKVSRPELPDWGHEEAYAWLGLVHADQNDFSEAEKNYQKALEMNPGYNWVIKILLPDVKKRMAEKNK